MMDQARKAQFSLLINARKLCLPIDIQCDMFEKVVSPILLYGSEVWGFSCTEMLEIFYSNLLKKTTASDGIRRAGCFTSSY